MFQLRTHLAICLLALVPAIASEKPNIVFVFCDDLGYGDVQVLNPEHGLIKTPHADSLAAQGMIFTDAHSGSSVCTPTRYGLLTGRYSWRTKLQKGVATGGKPNLIAQDRPTVASFLKEQGYDTAIIGKWHLNFQYQDAETGEILPEKLKGKAPVGSKILDGPLTRGFDYFHGVHHARSMEYLIENDTVILVEDTVKHLPRLTRKSVEYIEQRAASPDEPFFLYIPLGSPHTPIVPAPEWQGKSGLGNYADFVMQTDHALGEVKAALERTGLAKNTLILFSSDNGTSAPGAKSIKGTSHKWSAHYRGSKADIWEGGHRVPFIASWPGVIEPGSISDQTICLVDFFATTSDILSTPLPAQSAEDSVSFLPALKGHAIESTRKGIVHHSVSGHFGYRMGDWKLILARGSGGWSDPREKKAKKNPEAQLYNLAEDPSETTNLYATNPEVAQKLLAQLEQDVMSGRSTDGPPSPNDVGENGINLWKSGRD
ncbi:MAG: sulfatase family protein [Opitutales bacterium]